MKLLTILTLTIMLLAVSGADGAVHHIRGCRTTSCDHRVVHKAHKKTVARWRRVARPYAGWLASTRSCESGGDYTINNGNGFYGAYQFVLSTWASVGGHGYPNQAEPAEQDYRAVRLYKWQGRTPWPVCG